MSDAINKELSKRLLSTSRELLIHSLEHALAQEPTENDILQTVVNLQAALELLGKFYLVRREGWRAIIDAQFHSQTEAQILLAISRGTIKTIPYWRVRAQASEVLYLDDDDKTLLDNFQSRRNQLMHLGLANPSAEIANEAIWFLVRIINQLDWKEYLPVEQQFLSNSLRHVIGPDLYQKLIANSSYVGESVDRAYDRYGDATTCLECGQEALVTTREDDYLCLVCGFHVSTKAMGLLQCPKCTRSRSLAYDLLNVQENPSIRGKCGKCGSFSSVTRCRSCKTDHLRDELCPICR